MLALVLLAGCASSVPPALCHPEDVNRDGAVNQLDMDAVLIVFNVQNRCAADLLALSCRADLDRDGVVTINDLNLVQRAIGAQ